MPRRMVRSLSSLSSKLDPLRLEDLGGEIALAGVAEDGDHRLARAELARDAEGSTGVRTGGDSDQDSLLAGQAARVVGGFVVGNGDDVVVDVGVEDLGNEARTDPLNAVEAGIAAREHRRGCGLDGDDA